MVIHMTRQQLYTRGGILDELMDTGFSAAGLVDAAGRLIRYSVPTLRDLGKTQEECVGRPIEELDPDTHLGQVARGAVGAHAGEIPHRHGASHLRGHRSHRRHGHAGEPGYQQAQAGPG